MKVKASVKSGKSVLEQKVFDVRTTQVSVNSAFSSRIIRLKTNMLININSNIQNLFSM